MDEENHERRNVERLRKHYQESLPVMREQFLVGVIEGRIPQSRLEAQAPLLILTFPAGRGQLRWCTPSQGRGRVLQPL